MRWAEPFAAYLAGATFLWIALKVLVEGDRRSPVTRTLASAAGAVAVFNYGVLLNDLLLDQQLARLRVFWWCVPIMSAGWCAAAFYLTRDSFMPASWRWMRGALPLMCAWVIVQALLVVLAPERIGGQGARDWFYLVGVMQVRATLLTALLVYVRARRIYQRGHGLLTWFIPASLFVLAVALLIEIALWGPPAWPLLPESQWRALVSVPLLLALLCFAAFLLGAITANRALLGRPIRTRHMFVHWAGLLVICGLCAPEVISVLPAATGGLLAWPYARPLLALLAPLALAAFDWNEHRLYQSSIEQYRLFVQDSLGVWPISDSTTCRDQAQRIFARLVAQLDPRACYLHLQANPREPSFTLAYNWPCAAPPHDDGRYDIRKVEIGGQELGFIALSGPRSGMAYSALELDLARSCAFGIAGLYLHSRQTQALEALVVRRERERQERTQHLQRALHDRVVGNLDAIQKAVGLLTSAEGELVAEIGEAAIESMVLIRGLLRGELADLYPATLMREGLIAALRAEALARCQGERYKHIEIELTCGQLDDTVLNTLLSDELKRTLYAALDETIRNALKYAAGGTQRHVWVQVRLSSDVDGLRAEVEDSGVGFVPELANSEGDGMGLRYHQAALRLAGGTMQVESQPNHGTIVRLHLPQALLRQAQDLPSPARPPVLLAHSGIEWYRLILETEKLPTGRLLINDDLSDLTRTAEIAEQYYRCHGYTEEMMREVIAIDEQRRQIFDHFVREFPFYEIVDRRRLLRYIATGKGDHGYPGVDVACARAHVRNVLRLLREHEHYHLALDDHCFEANFAVKPGHAVLWEKRDDFGESRLDGIYEGIRDTDPGTVAEFTRRFEAAWAAVPPDFRETSKVIAWLERWLAEAEAGRLDEQQRVA